MVWPSIETRTIVGISCAILVVLFAIQPFGTSKIGSTFAPIVILWLLLNLALGIYVSPPPHCSYPYLPPLLLYYYLLLLLLLLPPPPSSSPSVPQANEGGIRIW